MLRLDCTAASAAYAAPPRLQLALPRIRSADGPQRPTRLDSTRLDSTRQRTARHGRRSSRRAQCNEMRGSRGARLVRRPACSTYIYIYVYRYRYWNAPGPPAAHLCRPARCAPGWSDRPPPCAASNRRHGSCGMSPVPVPIWAERRAVPARVRAERSKPFGNSRGVSGEWNPQPPVLPSVTAVHVPA